MAKRDVTDRIRQKVVETLRISGDDDSRKGEADLWLFHFLVHIEEANSLAIRAFPPPAHESFRCSQSACRGRDSSLQRLP